MPITAVWFLALALLSLGAFLVARVAAGKSAWRAHLIVLAGLVGLVAWALVIRRPALAVSVIDIRSLIYLEGVAGAPMLMLVLGGMLAVATRFRQRLLVAVGVAACAIYFAHGGMWMLEPSPAMSFPATFASKGSAVMQSRDYSCVPAACATALNAMGMPTTEQVMVDLTNTRPGQGATLIRAYDGLSRRLTDTGIEPILVEISAADLASMPLPIVLPLRFNKSNDHMVTILSRHPNGGYRVADPTDGIIFVSPFALAEYFTGKAIVFTGHTADGRQLASVAH